MSFPDNRSKIGPKPLGRARQLFGQHADVADDRHEVGVARPARHEVHVQMIEHAGARRPSEVHARH